MHQDNAPSHRMSITTECKTQKSTNTVAQPPYLPDLGPFELFIILKLKLIFLLNPLSVDPGNKELEVISKSVYETYFEEWHIYLVYV